jgi:hypothetical protein
MNRFPIKIVAILLLPNLIENHAKTVRPSVSTKTAFQCESLAVRAWLAGHGVISPQIHHGPHSLFNETHLRGEIQRQKDFESLSRNSFARRAREGEKYSEGLFRLATEGFVSSALSYDKAVDKAVTWRLEESRRLFGESRRFCADEERFQVLVPLAQRLLDRYYPVLFGKTYPWRLEGRVFVRPRGESHADMLGVRIILSEDDLRDPAKVLHLLLHEALHLGGSSDDILLRYRIGEALREATVEYFTQKIFSLADEHETIPPHHPISQGYTDYVSALRHLLIQGEWKGEDAPLVRLYNLGDLKAFLGSISPTLLPTSKMERSLVEPEDLLRRDLNIISATVAGNISLHGEPVAPTRHDFAGPHHGNGDSVLIFPADAEKDSFEHYVAGLDKEFGHWTESNAATAIEMARAQMRTLFREKQESAQLTSHFMQHPAYASLIREIFRRLDSSPRAIVHVADQFAAGLLKWDAESHEQLMELAIRKGPDALCSVSAKKLLSAVESDYGQMAELLHNLSEESPAARTSFMQKIQATLDLQQRICQWDFIHRYDGASGIRLTRGIKYEDPILNGEARAGDEVFFSQVPIYSANFAIPGAGIMVADVPVQSIMHTSWRILPSTKYEPEILLAGSYKVIGIFRTDDIRQIAKFEEFSNRYQRAVLGILRWPAIDIEAADKESSQKGKDHILSDLIIGAAKKYFSHLAAHLYTSTEIKGTLRRALLQLMEFRSAPISVLAEGLIEVLNNASQLQMDEVRIFFEENLGPHSKLAKAA